MANTKRKSFEKPCHPAISRAQTSWQAPPRKICAPARLDRDQAERRELKAGLLEHIGQPDFPCVGAKAALAQDGLTIAIAASIASAADDARIHQRLVRWANALQPDAQTFFSFAVVFAGPPYLDECGFEALLWERLGRLSAIDRTCGYQHDPAFSADPRDPHFALSFGGMACFAVGLHPRASRRARRVPSPVIVFNPHQQFAALREADRYERMREVILDRDTQFDGAPNPMVARHGEISEARQYSGRAVGRDWVCPYAPAETGQ